MKKNVLCLALLAAISAGSAASAATALTGGKSVSLDGILADAENAPAKNVMAYSGNSLYASGNFDTPFGGMSPLTTGDAFIIKYSTGMVEQWKVQLMGTASVTTIVADDNGGIYVGGTFADIVEMGSTDGNTQSIEGYQEAGVATVFKAASFVAHYNAAGVLLDVGTVVPTHDPALDATGMYFPDAEYGDTQFALSKLLVSGGKLYGVGTLKGQITNAAATETATSGSYDAFGIGFYMPATAGVVVEFGFDFTVSSIPVVATGKTFADGLQSAEEVVSMSATASDSNLYVGFNSIGNIDVNVFGTKSTVDNPLSVDGGYNIAYTIMSIGLEAKESNIETFDIIHTNVDYISTAINDMAVADDNLIITGLFQSSLGFDQSVNAVSSSDMYVVSLNAADLSLNWAKATGYNEGEATDYEETITGSAILNDIAYIYGSNEQKSDRAKQASLFYSVNLADGTLESMNPEDYIFGMASDGANIATAHTTVPVSGITFTTYGEFASVNDIAAGKAQTMSVYPNPVADVLRFSQPCNVKLYSLDGKQLLDATGTTALDVTGLGKGVYVVEMECDGETAHSKVLKK